MTELEMMIKVCCDVIDNAEVDQNKINDTLESVVVMLNCIRDFVNNNNLDGIDYKAEYILRDEDLLNDAIETLADILDVLPLEE